MSDVMTIAAEDRASYETWVDMEMAAYTAAGNDHWFSERKASAIKWRRRGAAAPRTPFTGPFWVVAPWLTGEALEWFASRERFTFTDWQDRERARRAEQTLYLAEDSTPLAQLAYIRELADSRAGLIAEARAEGAAWADIIAATGLSRAQASAIYRDYMSPVTSEPEPAAVVAEVAPEWDAAEWVVMAGDEEPF